jgi:phosphate transport system protein
MHRHFEEQLEEMTERLLTMGSLVEKGVHQSVESLIQRNEALATQVIAEIEPQINDLQMELDERALQLLALQQPLATDLRRITSSMKINSDLERIGDKAVSIAHRALSILSHRFPAKLFVDIPHMAEMAEKMVRDSLDAFVRRDDELARQVVLRDDEVDRFRDRVFGDLLSSMIKDPRSVQLSLDMILVARSLERIADHATNIAEDVIYMVLGRDIRHNVEAKMNSNPS